jgi:hypothetical protein
MATLLRRALSTPWRARVRTRSYGLRSDARLAAEHRGLAIDDNDVPQPGQNADLQYLAVVYRAVTDHAKKAEECGSQSSGPLQWLNGSMIEAAWAEIHEADVQLIELFNDDHLIGRIPEVLGTVRAYLPPEDTRRIALEAWSKAFTGTVVDHEHRELIATTLRAAYLFSDTEHGRVRSFRNVLLGTAVAITVLLLGIGFVGLVSAHSVSLCFTKAVESTTTTPAKPMLICPTGERDEVLNGPSGWDVFLVELVGLIGAALAGVRAIAGSRKDITPYSLTVTQAALKAATGAATAVVGMLFLSAGIVPGLSQLQSQAAILAYAVVFGYAQQLLTGMIDQRANAMLKAASPVTPAGPAAAPALDGSTPTR